MPSLSNSSSLFGRITGKRQVTEQQQGEARRLSPPLEIPAESEGNKLIKGHRRESSVLSLTSVSELTHNVKRSVSLRSHRSQPSETSNKFGHKARSSSSAIQFSPTLTISPSEDEEPSALPTSTHTSPPSTARPRTKPSLSATSLSSKFSSQSLSTFSQADSFDSTTGRPTTAFEVRKVPSSSMLAAPAIPRGAPPKAPSAASSFSAPNHDATPSNTTSHGLYMQGTATPVPYHASTHDPKAVYKQIHETSAKRMATIEYLRKVHEGNIFYFGTLHYNQASLQAVPSLHPLKLGRRATNYFVLGYSLPALLDLNLGSPLEYLRALISLLQEFETYQNLMGVDSSGNSLTRGRVQNMFKMASRTNKGRRTSTANESISIQGYDLLGLPKPSSEAASPLEASPSPVSPGGYDFQHLVTPHLPFDPDFTMIYSTLCDTLIDTYAKLINLVPSPDVCSPAVGDAFGKVDKSLRKILVSNVMREFEECTRASVKGEVAGLANDTAPIIDVIPDQDSNTSKVLVIQNEGALSVESSFGSDSNQRLFQHYPDSRPESETWRVDVSIPERKMG